MTALQSCTRRMQWQSQSQPSLCLTQSVDKASSANSARLDCLPLCFMKAQRSIRKSKIYAHSFAKFSVKPNRIAMLLRHTYLFKLTAAMVYMISLQERSSYLSKKE